MAQQAAARQGTHATKTRGEVRGGGRKPYKQKGTGRARQGSTRAPQFAGGGVVHGPQPRSYAQRTPKKMVAAALRGALSDRARDGRIHVVESLISGDTPSTKSALAALRGVVADRANFLRRARALRRADLALAAQRGRGAHRRRRPGQHLRRAGRRRRRLHPGRLRRVRRWHRVLGERPAALVHDRGRRGAAAKADKKAEATEDRRRRPTKKAAKKAEEGRADRGHAARQTDDDKPELPKGAKAPLKSGGAPKGFEVKGNADSGLYHEPDGQWYDQTEAEFYFKTAEDAEAAGFTRAGGGQRGG